MKIGILQAGHAAPAVVEVQGDYTAMYSNMLAGHGFTFETWSVVDMEFPSSAEAADGWLISGSKHGAYEDHAFIPPLEDLIRDIVAAQKPLIGVCFGHQIIAQALGGTVEKFAGGWAVGRHSYTIGGAQMHLNAWHQDQVTAVPDGAEVIGASEFCTNAMIHYPPVPLQEAARAALPLPDDNANMADQLAQFLKTKRLPA